MLVNESEIDFLKKLEFDKNLDLNLYGSQLSFLQHLGLIYILDENDLSYFKFKDIVFPMRNKKIVDVKFHKRVIGGVIVWYTKEITIEYLDFMLDYMENNNIQELNYWESLQQFKKDKLLPDIRLYILVNKDIELSPNKAWGQIGHAINSYLDTHFIHPLTKSEDENFLNMYRTYMYSQKKILLAEKQAKLEVLEKDGLIAIRDSGWTELEPQTLTCVVIGLLDRNSDDFPKHLKKLRIYKYD